MKAERIYFNPQEVLAISMGLGLIMDDFNANKLQPWTPETRKTQAQILAAVKSAAAKLEKFTGIKCELPPYEEGDENEFLTKQS